MIGRSTVNAYCENVDALWGRAVVTVNDRPVALLVPIPSNHGRPRGPLYKSVTIRDVATMKE